jgi:hypothetical protein
LQERHLQYFTLEIKAMDGQMLSKTGVMAFSHHELSVENAVIPFSLRLPASSSSASPITFKMEHFQ